MWSSLAPVLVALLRATAGGDSARARDPLVVALVPVLAVLASLVIFSAVRALRGPRAALPPRVAERGGAARCAEASMVIKPEARIFSSSTGDRRLSGSGPATCREA
jgi:hypothetical protein